MQLSTKMLNLAPDAKIDLQLHTVYSDGKWQPSDLLDYLKAHDFALAAITDHERADTLFELQNLAIEKQMPLLCAVEISSMWQNHLTDFLCFGIKAGESALNTLAQDVTRRQHENTREVFENLKKAGYALDDSELADIIAQPSAQQLNELIALVTKHRTDDTPVGRVPGGAGFAYITTPPAQIVEAAHADGAICILAHPGRSDGFVTYDGALLDALREEAPIDGIEVYYPAHSPEQIAAYEAYAAKYDLLISSGSDSHSPERPPIPYRAAQSRALLERLGIVFQA